MNDDFEPEWQRQYTLTGVGPWWTFRVNEDGWFRVDLGTVLNYLQKQGATIHRVDRTHYPKVDVNPASDVYTVLVSKGQSELPVMK